MQESGVQAPPGHIQILIPPKYLRCSGVFNSTYDEAEESTRWLKLVFRNGSHVVSAIQ